MTTPLNKTELIAAVAEETQQSKAVVERVVAALENKIIDTVKDGRDVKWSGFVALDRAVRAERKGKHPVTGEDLVIPEHNVVRVRPLSKLRKAVSAE